MTAVAALLVVGALELEIPDIVQSNDIREALRGMTIGAVGSELPFVHGRLGMACTTAIAILRSRLELDAWVAVRALHTQMLPR